MINANGGAGLREEFTEDIAHKVVKHRNAFYRLIRGRYRELLPTLLSYQTVKHNPLYPNSIDFLKLEIALRQNANVVVGLDRFNQLKILGFYDGVVDFDDLNFYRTKRRLTKNDIDFIIPKEEQQDGYREITASDNYATGNFVVFRNKTINLTNDFEIIDHYSEELAEIISSRYSLSIQSKMLTFIIGEYGDESINQVANAMYNGQPYIKTTKFFDPEEQIIFMENSNASTNLVELKREYQNKLSELNNMLGIDSLAVEKASGVNEAEALGNSSYTQSNANIYLKARNQSLKKLYKRFDIGILVEYDNLVQNEFRRLEGGTNESNDNPRRTDAVGTEEKRD